jgi:hypothetical protein
MTEEEIDNADQFVKINNEICDYVLGCNHSPESASRFLHGPKGLLNYVPRRFRHRINSRPHIDMRRSELWDRAKRNASWGI